MEIIVPQVEQNYKTYEKAKTSLELKFICRLIAEFSQNVFSMKINNNCSIYKVKSSANLNYCTKYKIKKHYKFPNMLLVLTDKQELFVFGNNFKYQLGLQEAKFVDNLVLLKDNVQDFVCFHKKENIYLLVISNNKLFVSGYNKYGQLGIGKIDYTPLTPVITDNFPKYEKLELIKWDNLHVAIALDGATYISGINDKINSNIFVPANN